MKEVQSVTASLIERRKVLKLGAGAAAAASFGFATPALAQRAKVFRYGHNLPVETVYHKAVVKFAEEVGKLSSGKLKVDIYPTSQLGSIPEMLSAVKVGSLSMAQSVPAWYSNFMKPIDAFTLPYIVSSTSKLRVGLEGKLGVEIDKFADAAGFKIFGYYLIGSRHIANRVRQVNRPADTQGLKIRVINSQVYIQAFQALGAVPVAMDAAELYLAMQQGAVDGYETALPDIVAFKWYEVSKFICLDAHTTDFFLCAANKAMWDGLSSEEKSIFEKAMKTSMDYQWVAQPDDIKVAEAKLRSLVAVNDIAPADKELFVKATRPVYEKFESSIGKDFLALCIKELS